MEERMIASNTTLVVAGFLTLLIPAGIYAVAVLIGWRIGRRTP
jgi:hypothetical protein